MAMRARTLATAGMLVVGCGRGAPPTTGPISPPTPTPTVTATPGPRLDARPILCEGARPGDDTVVELTCSDVRHSRMLRPRTGPLAVALAGGALLVVGGDASRDHASAGDADAPGAGTAELYDPALGRWLEVPAPAGLVAADGWASRLIATDEGPTWLGAAIVDDRVRITLARFDVDHRTWSAPEAVPLTPPAGRHVAHVVAAQLTDGALLVVTVDRATLREHGRWRALPPLPPTDDVVTWVAPLPDGDALVGGRFVLARGATPSWRDLGAAAPERVIRGTYAPVVLGDGRIAIAGGCSDGGECWGDSELDVFDPTSGRYLTSPPVLGREHSAGPVAVALGADRLLLTSDFGDGRELEHCTVPADPTAALACRCGACDVPARDAFAMVRADRDCALILGGTIDGEATTDVLRFCWSDRPWPAAADAASADDAP